MSPMIPLTIGVLFTVGIYLILSRSLLNLLLGFLVLCQGANLMLFLSGGLRRGEAAFITTEGGAGDAESLTQALILTAIVIGFSMTAFLVVLIRQSYLNFEEMNFDFIRRAEP